MQFIWFFCLISAVCLEGLGRKYLPAIPSGVFYFIKDVILLFGYFQFRPPAAVRRISTYLYRGFSLFWIVGCVWTIIEVFNPAQESIVLGLIGIRAYWLWWLAPPLIASALQDETQKKRFIYVLLVLAIGVSALAALQFASPATSDLNLYSVVDGEEVHAADIATISATGRARVASTFAFLSGFQDFTLLVPTLLLSLGLEAKERRLRWSALTATFCVAAVIPMSGSRASVLLGAAILLIAAWTAGLFLTRIGRRVLIGGMVAAVLSVTVFPDAILGVQSRFDDQEEVNGRYLGVAEALLPPLALANFHYPALGIGTGMQQNVRIQMHIRSPWEEELESGRYLVELGPVGFLTVWTAKLGLIVALLRAYAILKRAGRRGAAAAAVSYAALTLTGNLTFDHVFQALYFIGCGFILAEVVSAVREGALALDRGEAAAVPSGSPSLAPAPPAL